jgi:hypothetical protein
MSPPAGRNGNINITPISVNIPVYVILQKFLLKILTVTIFKANAIQYSGKNNVTVL